MKSLIRRMAISTAVISLAATGASVPVGANAATAVDQWVSRFGSNAPEARKVLNAEAQRKGVSAETLAQRAINNVRRNNADVAALDLTAAPLQRRPGTSSTTSVNARTSSGGGSGDGWVPAVPAAYRGDFFYYPSSSAGINHGHVGVYRWRKVIVEAANKDVGVRKIDVALRKFKEGKTYILWVDTSFAKQEKAADWTAGRIGAKYRSWWSTSNKYVTGPFNCSQLLWAAYKKQYVYLDSNGGDYVWPADIVNHSKTKPYKKV